MSKVREMKNLSRKSYGSKPSKESLISRGLAVEKLSQNKSDVPVLPSTSGYSLYSTDSEDPVPMMNKGLDRCAALLANILEGDTSTSQPKYNANKIINQKRNITKPKATKVKQEKIEYERPKCKVKKGRKVKVDPNKKKENCPSVKLDSQGVTAFHKRLVTSTPAKKSLSPETLLGQENQHQQNPSKKSIPCTQLKQYPQVLIQPVKDNKRNHCMQGKHSTKYPCQQKKSTHQKITPSYFVTDEECDLEQEGDVTPTNADVGVLTCRSPIVERGCGPEPTSGGAKQNRHCVNQLRTAKYLMSELQALLQANCDVETQRLLSEMDQTLNTMPHHTALSPSISTEIELALQPLRTENSHLRRKLRIANQKMRDVESQLRDHDNPNFELLSSKALVEVLQLKLKDEQNVTNKLKEENEDMKKEICKSLKEDISTDENQIKLDVLQQEYEALNKQLGQTRLDLQSVQFQLQGNQKELNIKELCLNQKDGEIKRMKEINKSLQQTISSLLIELKDHSGKQQSSQITAWTQDIEGAISSAYTSDWVNTQDPIHKARKDMFGVIQTERNLKTPNIFTDQRGRRLISDEFRKTETNLPNSESVSHMSSSNCYFESMFKETNHHGILVDAQDHEVNGIHGHTEHCVSHDVHDRVSHNRHDRVSHDLHDRLSHDRHDRVSHDLHDRLSPDVHDRVSHDLHDRLSPDVHDRVSPDVHDHALYDVHDSSSHGVHDRVSYRDHLSQDVLNHVAHNGPDHKSDSDFHISGKYIVESHRPKISSTSPMTDTFKQTMLNTTNYIDGTRSETTVSSVTSRDEYIFQEGLNKLDLDIEALQRNLIHMGISFKYNSYPKC